MKVCARAELFKMIGRKLSFHITAWNEVKQIGDASHIRFLIDAGKFMARVEGKGK